MRPNEFSMPASNNPRAYIVYQGDGAQVEVVVINGRVVKHAGKLLDHDLDSIRKTAERSRDYLIEKVGRDRIREMMTKASTNSSAPPPKNFVFSSAKN